VPAEPTAYLVEHVRECLIHDPEIGELDVHVAIDGNRVVITGNVSTVERRDAVARAVAGCLPGHEVRNDTTVTDYAEGGEEVL
jgi:hypothetical protein